MRLLFISHELPPAGGGGGRAAWHIARRLVRCGHEVTLLTAAFGDAPESELRDGVLIRRCRARRRRADVSPPGEILSFLWRAAGAAIRVARETRPDAVCAFFAVPGGPAAWRLRRRAGIPYVVSLRGSDVPRPEIARYQRLHIFTKPVIRRVLRDAAAVVAVSEPLRRAALRLLPGLAVHVIPNGVDVEFYSPSCDAGKQIERAEVLFVGRLQPFKGLQHLLDSLPILERRLGRAVRLTVAGDGPLRRSLEAKAARLGSAGLRSEVRFLGWIDAEHLRSAYREASVLVLPSLVEGHPNVLLEAMATGVPCVVADAPGLRELVSPGAGMVVPPASAEAIAASVAELLTDPAAWRRAREAGLARARSFSWDEVAAGYEALLDRAARGGDVEAPGLPVR